MQSSDPSKDVLMDKARDTSLNDATPTSPIFDLSRNCMKKYQALCGMLRDTTRGEANRNSFDRDEVLLGVQDAQYRFKAWATNIAALQESHLKSSLDFRLQEATEIRGRVLKILEDLRGSLTDATSIVVGDRANETWEVGALSDSEEDEDSVSTSDVQQTSELEELLSAIKTANSSLLEISMVIRSTPRRDDYIKAAVRCSLDSRWDIGHVQEKFGSAQRSPDWLIQQLGRSITRRRQYLTYRKEHHGKLTRDWSTPLEDISDIKFDEELPEQTIALTKATTFVEVATNVQKDGSEVGSFGSQTSYEQTVAGESEQRQLTVPPPPQEAFDGVPFEFGKPFQCPYCYTEQSVKNRNAWKKHVFRDLRPYVCTFKECNLRMFRSRNEWFAHELQNHRREWMCPTCNKPFATKSSFRTHSQTHDPALAGSELEALALQCEEPINRFPASACTLCDEWEAQVTDPKQDGRRAMLNDGKDVKPYGTSGQFRRHLGRHMEQLALFALPREEGDLNEVADGSIDATNSESDLENAEISPSAHALSPSGSSEGTTGPTPLYDLYGSDFDVNMPWTCCRCKRTMPSGLLVICTNCKTGRCSTCQQERVMDPERQSVSPTSSEYKRLIQEVEQNVIHARNVNIATQLVSPSNALGSKSEEVLESNASLDHLTRIEQAVVGAAPLPISIDGQMHPGPHADMAMTKEERTDKEQSFHTQRPARLPLPPEDQTIDLGDEELIKKYAEEDAEESRQQRNDGTVPITFEWKAGGEKVSVAGSFTEWNKKTRLHPVYNQPGLHRAIIHIRPGRHHLRFIVDGVMKCSPDLPTTVDSGNNLINHIEVGVPSEGENPQTTERKIKEVYATTDANLPLPENTDPNFYDNLEAGSQDTAPAADEHFQRDDFGRPTSSAERDRYEPHQKIEPRQLTEEEEKENARIYEAILADKARAQREPIKHHSMIGRTANALAPIAQEDVSVADSISEDIARNVNKNTDSITDNEDLEALSVEGADDAGSLASSIARSVARRLRWTTGEKTSLFFDDPPPRIVEKEEESELEEDSFEAAGRQLDPKELLQIRQLAEDRQKVSETATTPDTKGKTKIMPYYISPNPSGEHKKPIRFKDAIGRKFTFPFHHCNSWVGMEALIKQAFKHVDVIGPHVQEGYYDLIGPSGEIILPQVWEDVIQPDWAVTMHMWPMPERDIASATREGGAPPLTPGYPPTTPRKQRPRSEAGGFLSWMSGGKSSKKKKFKWPTREADDVISTRSTPVEEQIYTKQTAEASIGEDDNPEILDAAELPSALKADEHMVRIQAPDRTITLLQGETLRQLQERSGCYVRINPKEQIFGGVRTMTLKGTPEATARAKAMIREIDDFQGDDSVVSHSKVSFGDNGQDDGSGGSSAAPVPHDNFIESEGITLGSQENPPCDTVQVAGNAKEQELKDIFFRQPGYKRLMFRKKLGVPTCLVQFEDIESAKTALYELADHPLRGLDGSGLQLSFSKHSLGERDASKQGSAAGEPGLSEQDQQDKIDLPNEKPAFLDISKRSWKYSDDQTLKTAREQGMNWAEIHQKYFPGRTPLSCRKRHEMLMGKQPNSEQYSGRMLEEETRDSPSNSNEDQASTVSASTRPPPGPWTVADDQTLAAAQVRGMRWSDIRREYFPDLTVDACRERYELLQDMRMKLAEFSSAQEKLKVVSEIAQQIDSEDQTRMEGMNLPEQNSFDKKLDTGYMFNSKGDIVGIARETIVLGSAGFAERPMQTREETLIAKEHSNDEEAKVNSPCDTLSIRNLPSDTDDSELRSKFFRQPGFRRMFFTKKHDDVYAMVQFQDVAFATAAISEVSGHTLSNSVNGGIVVVYARHPLGNRFKSNGVSGATSLSKSAGALEESLAESAIDEKLDMRAASPVYLPEIQEVQSKADRSFLKWPEVPEIGSEGREQSSETGVKEDMDLPKNAKPSWASPFYECRYKPCPYRSKRESTCNQHMDKVHGWKPRSDAKDSSIFEEEELPDAGNDEGGYPRVSSALTSPENAPSPVQLRARVSPPGSFGKTRHRPEQSSRISDRTPPTELDEAACRRKLTTYAVYTIRKATPRDVRERPTWAKAEVTEERWTQEDVIRQLKKLDVTKRTVVDKKAALTYFQQGQISTLLDDLEAKDVGNVDSAFQWSLIQLDRTEKSIASPSGGASNKIPKYETVTITVYVRRSPRQFVDAVVMYQRLERDRAERTRLSSPSDSNRAETNPPSAAVGQKRRAALPPSEDGPP